MTEPSAPRLSPCPTCGKLSLPEFRPFCSKRCRDVDLNRWFSGVYAIPVREEEDEDGERPPDPPGGDKP